VPRSGCQLSTSPPVSIAFRSKDDVDERVQLDRPAGIRIGPEHALIDERRSHDAAVEGLTGSLLGFQPIRLNEPVPVSRLPAADPHRMDHPIAFQREGVAAERRELRVGAVAHEDAVDVARKTALDQQLIGVALPAYRRESPRQVRISGHIHGAQLLSMRLASPRVLRHRWPSSPAAT
jgi:hypothetical protein